MEEGKVDRGWVMGVFSGIGRGLIPGVMVRRLEWCAGPWTFLVMCTDGTGSGLLSRLTRLQGGMDFKC